jgi:type I restriction enzyme S subunit
MSDSEVQVPDGWKTYTLAKVASSADRYSLTGGPFGSNLKVSDYTESGIRIIQLQNIGDGKFLNNYKIYTSTEKADELSSCNIYPDDIIMSKMGDPVARATIMPSFSSRYVMASDGIRLAIDRDHFDNRFILNAINFHSFRGQAEMNGTGTTRKRIGLSALRELYLIAPPLPEQKKIASILTSVDDVIEKTEAQISKLQDLKKGMMTELLTKGIGHTEFKDSPVGQIPVSWEMVKFKDIALSITCGVAATPKYVDKDIGIPFLSSQNVSHGSVDLSKFKYIKKDLHHQLTKNTKPKRNDILYTRVGVNYGEAAIVNFDWEFSVYVSLTLIKMKAECDVTFYKYLLNSRLCKFQAKMGVFAGAGVPNLNVAVVKNFNMVLPPKKEQKEIASILTSIDSNMESKQKKLSYTKSLKKALMNDLLTGKVRVSTTTN